MTGTTITPEREQEITRLRGEMFDQRMREAGIAGSRTYGSLSEHEKDAVAQTFAACGRYEHKLRDGARHAPSTTRTLVNTGLIDLGAEGIPMVGAPSLREPQDLDGPALMQALGEDGVTLTERSAGRPRERLNMKLREGQSPEEGDTPAGIATPTSTRVGADAGDRVACPTCDGGGLRDHGTPCGTCNGAGVLIPVPGEAAKARTVQRLAESAIESAADLAGVPLRSDGDLDGALATAIELGGAGDHLDKRTDDGLFDLSTAPGVPLVDDGEAATEPPDGDLIDLTDEPGVPNVAVKKRSVAELLREADEVAA